VKNVRFLPTACEPAVHRPLPAAALCDLSFARRLVADARAARGMLAAQGRRPARLRAVAAQSSPRFAAAARAARARGFFSPQRMAEIFAACKRRSTSTPGAGASITG